MMKFRMPLVLLLASGLWAGVASAQNLDLTNLATRAIDILVEDSACTNPGTIDPNYYPPLGNASCTALGFAGTNPASLCTGPGTGTYVPGGARPTFAVNPALYYTATSPRGPYLSPDFQVATAGCTTFAADGGADFTDLTNDFYGVLTSTGVNTWRITVPERVWGAGITETLSNTPGTTFRQTLPLIVDFNSATGVVTPGAPPNYYIATAGFAGPPALNLNLQGQSSTPTAPFFGTPYQVGNTTPLQLDCAGTLALDLAAGGAVVTSTIPPFPVAETGVSFGTGYPHNPPFAAGICPPLVASPGYIDTAGVKTITAFAKANILLSATLAATSPAAAPLDWKVEEAVDSDADLVPDAFDDPNDPDRDGIVNASDNCDFTPNPDQADSGGLGGPAPDGIGNACQCGDIDNNGQITSADATQLRRATLGLTPLNSVGGLMFGQAVPGVPVLNKCNVGAASLTSALAECTVADATVISRALLALPPGIAQNCKAAKATIP